jgi:hypothetical protein
MSEIVPQGEAATPAADVKMLARELAASYSSAVEYHRRKQGLPPAEAVAKAEEPFPTAALENILRAPADQGGWWGLEALARHDPELAYRRWEGVKSEARDELQSGERAAKAMEGYDSTPWQRARFLAIREELARDWQPRNGVERQLLDQMAQAQSAVYFWQERLMQRASVEPIRERRDVEEAGGWCPPRVTDHQALEQAGAMVDRFNRILLRTLRALRDLRRYAPAVVIRSAGQVNVGQQQLNVGAGG